MLKMNSGARLTTLVFIIFCTHKIAFSEVVKIDQCRRRLADKTSNSISCEIQSVNISPCPKASEEQELCSYIRGKNFSIEINFKPNFNATKLLSNRYSVGPFNIEVRDFTYRDHNACLYTTPGGCPIKAGESYKFYQQIPVLSWYPTGSYTAKWTLTNENEEECCFQFRAAVV